MTCIAVADLAEFERTGLIKVPGAVRYADAAAMCDRIWEHLQRVHDIDRENRASWTVDRPTRLRPVAGTEAFGRIGTATVRGVLDALLGAGRWPVPRRWARLLVTFPDSAEWHLPLGVWHNDFHPGHGDGVRAVQMFILLNEVRPRGGGTLVVCGSHQLIRRYMDDTGEDPHPRRLRRALEAHSWSGDLWNPPPGLSSGERARRAMVGGAVVDGIPLRVVELTGDPGDVYFMHCDTFHAAAPNALDVPRMMATSMISRLPDTATVM